MSEREREIRIKLSEIHWKHMQAYNAEAKPFLDELVGIEMRKRPKPVMGHDGKLYEYIGPWFGDPGYEEVDSASANIGKADEK